MTLIGVDYGMATLTQVEIVLDLLVTVAVGSAGLANLPTCGAVDVLLLAGSMTGVRLIAVVFWLVAN